LRWINIDRFLTNLVTLSYTLNPQYQWDTAKLSSAIAQRKSSAIANTAKMRKDDKSKKIKQLGP